MGRTKTGKPMAKFTVTVDDSKYKGKPQKKLVGSYINENNEKILISIDNKKSYSPKNKPGVKFYYATAINLGHYEEYSKPKGQMG